MRYIFYGMIILVAVLALVLLGQVIYWGCRIFVCKHTAALIHWSALGCVAVVLIVASLWGNLVTRFQLDVNRVDVVSENVPEDFDGYRIAQISDLHLDWFDSVQGRSFIDRLADSIAAEKPDIIVFTGDLVTIQSAEAEPFRKALARLANLPLQSSSKGQESSSIPVYSILGNHDYADYTRMSARERYNDVEHLCQLQRETGWKLLRNESVLLLRNSSNIQLIGVENIGEPPFSTYGDLKKAMATEHTQPSDSNFQTSPHFGEIEGGFKILLSHNPTHWRSEVLPTTNIDLMLAGHTHAVQIRIVNWSPAKWKYPEWGGLYSVIGTNRPQYLYVNTGIGGVGPRIRIGVPPELTILTLRRPSTKKE